ncbi:tetratricopeptide repeat protein [Kutzneria chonburiensis]|uniref:Tetratricopeptide repeat protein n=1 Tax=Kutzneria chonburiensis TaxID=1483604 RepID=A0ABV6N1Y8_9PSEU|nr:tetratricopeptide repeat protein [Kutzneria chonburiensis]
MDADTIAELLETAEKRRARAAEDPAHLADLADALLNLAVAYNDHGEFPDAIATAEEAVDIWRSADGDHRGSLAVGLATVSGYYLAIGLDEEANAAAAEAANLS